jgi:hypothetical protein
VKSADDAGIARAGIAAILAKTKEQIHPVKSILSLK